MSDKELLELAAKAVGLKFHAYVDSEIFGSGINTGELDTPLWNPLADDGDALRLAVELDFNVYHAASSVFVEDLDSEIEVKEGHERDKFSATRRAIVCAAAEVGKAMT